MKVQPRQRAAGPQPLAHLCGLLRHFLAALSLLCIALAGCTVQRSGRRGLARQPGCQRSTGSVAPGQSWCWAWCLWSGPAAPGLAGRHDMGLVIFAGLSIGTLFTLFMVPAMYMFGARRVELLWELA